MWSAIQALVIVVVVVDVVVVAAAAAVAYGLQLFMAVMHVQHRQWLIVR